MSNRSEYLFKENSILNVEANQAVIVTKRYVPYLVPRGSQKQPKPKPSPSLLFDPEDFDQSYPSVNSYYAFTEDVDAFARVHHLLESKCPVDVLEKNDGNQNIVNEYSSKKALHQFLYSKPISFLILGKPGLGEEEVGKRLADFWKCVYIDPLTLLQDEIASDTRPGQCIEFNLRIGRSIGIDILIRLLSKRIQSNDVLHRGFVCCGFPLIPNDLYEEDPISSESAVFTVREIFEDIVDQTLLTTDVSGRVAVSIADSTTKEDSDERKSDVAASDQHSTHSGPNIFLQWSLESPICGPVEIETNLEKQMNFIFGLFHNPFVIIYVHSRDSDVVTKRDNYYFDSYTSNKVDMQKVKMFYDVGSSDEALVEDLFHGGSNPFAENPTLKHIVKVPENFPANVNTQLDRYHRDLVNILDSHVLQHDQQYYIKVDGRSFVSQMLNIIKLRLQVLPIQPVVLPSGFLTIQEDIGEDAAPNDFEQMSLEEAFLKFSKQNIANPLYPWKWSNWSTFCPVSMFQGVYQKGSPKFAARFSDKIYFMASEIYYHRFMENPRSYLLPPFPKPGSNGFVFGPPVSGKTAVTKCLGYVLNSKVLTPGEMHTEYFNEVVVEYQKKVKQIAIAEAMEILKEKRLGKLEQQQREIAHWEEESREWLQRLDLILKNQIDTYMSSFPLKMEGEPRPSILNEIEIIRQRLTELNFETNIGIQDIQKMLDNNNLLHEHMPQYLKEEAPEPSVHEPFVLEYANKKVDKIDLEELRKKTQENVYEIYSRSIRAAENLAEHYGWLIDGMTTDVNLIRQVSDEFPIYEIIVLMSSDNTFLIEKLKKQGEPFKDFRNFLLKMGERDAAWRAPSSTSLKSINTEQFAAGIVSDLVNSIGYVEPTESERELFLENYKTSLDTYKQEITQTLNFFEEQDIHPVVINVDNVSTDELLEEVLYRVQDKYRLQSYQVTEADRAEEMQRFLALAAATEDEGEGGFVVTDEFIHKHRKYGDTHIYCPVTFTTKFVLWRGKEEFAAMFKDKVYLCANETNLKKFIKFPRKYIIETAPPDWFPPPRICVVGANAEITSIVSERLAKNIGVRYIHFGRIHREAVENLSSTSLLLDDNNAELPEALLLSWYDVLFSRIWFEDPYKHIGFVMDGFPDKPNALDYMVFQEAIPDIILHVAISQEDNLTRRLNKSLTEWKKNMEIQRKEEEAMNLIVHEQWEQFRKTRYNELIEMKRQERYSQKIRESVLDNIDEKEISPTNFKSDTQISVDSVLEQQEHDEVMKILDEEFPEPTFEQDDEDNEELVAQEWTAEIEANYGQCMERFNEIKKICETELIPFVEIDGGQDVDKVVRHAFIIGNDLKFRGPSFFERCYDVSLETAEKLLNSGFIFLSSFGRLCPVQYYDGYESLHAYLASKQNNTVYPVLHRKYIYFLISKKNRDRFYKNPLKYTTQQNLNFPIIPMRVAVIGPPKSGKTALSKRFHRDMGFRTLSRGEAIRYVISNPLYSNLNQSVEEVLRKGEVLSDETVMNCVYAASFCGESVSQGLFFDGFPNSISEMNYLSRLGLVPHLIFDLQISEKQLYKQAATPDDRDPQYSSRFINHRLTEWSSTQKQFRDWCDREYQNIYKLPVDRSIWGVWDHAREVTLSVTFERKHYYKHVKLNWPLRLANMLVTPLEFLERQSSYKTYCPGCLYYSRKLMYSGEIPDRTGLIHYEKSFYWLCEEHIDDFLKDPDKFLPPSNVLLPQELPKRTTLKDEKGEAVEDGYCLTCYINNIPKKVLNKGNSDYAIKYRDRLYVFDTVQCLTSFMQTPEKSCRYVINFRAEDESTCLQYRNLPIIGMLEQYLAETLVRSVNHANVVRPIIPGLSISQAAVIFIGLNLKTHNPNTQHLEKYEHGLKLFNERRENLVKYLEIMKNYLNPFVHYEEPDTPSSTEVEDSGHDDDY